MHGGKRQPGAAARPARRHGLPRLLLTLRALCLWLSLSLLRLLLRSLVLGPGFRHRLRVLRRPPLRPRPQPLSPRRLSPSRVSGVWAGADSAALANLTVWPGLSRPSSSRHATKEEVDARIKSAHGDAG